MKQIASIKKELAISGAPRRVLRSAEVSALSQIMSHDEEIMISMQGLYDEGIGLIVATNARLLIVNKSWFWQRVEDESYSMVNSVVYKQGILLGKVYLSTRARRYTFTVLKSDPIESFVSFIDRMMRLTQPNQAPSNN